MGVTEMSFCFFVLVFQKYWYMTKELTYLSIVVTQLRDEVVSMKQMIVSLQS